ncbi:hypothetical protein P0082_05930 [Candidatus Haliotispira prima]|uniref:SbsA Ig-like domain-containing protein n=1 Tax=Candidatus Haliotispira prima TaxID=3034016 RepID=A0ABY8MK43_9SPIO|nr:hypothetical protein P0082_05930 [Candidatus Haliotispira prima]
MAWVSMREGLVQLDNGTQGIRTIGVIVSRETEPPAYAGVKDLPGFYTRKTKTDGTPRTVYLSMTDKMTAAAFTGKRTVSVDGQATGFVRAIAAAPELLHPNTKYYAHFYEIADATGTTGAAIEKLEFTTEDFPASFPTARGTYSRFYDQIAAGSSSPAMEYKASEIYFIPTRYYFIETSGFYVFSLDSGIIVDSGITYDISATSPVNRRPFPNITSTSETGLFYDVYNMTASGPGTGVRLWDGMLRIFDLNSLHRIDAGFGGNEFIFYVNNKAVLVTE